MVDVIQSGDTITRPVSPPPAVKVNMEPAPVGPELLPHDPENVVTRRLPGEPIHLSEDGRELKDEIRRRREGNDDAITEWRAADALPPPGESESTAKQLRKASESMLLARRAAAAEQLVKDGAGYITPEVADAAITAAKDLPPEKVGVVTDNGNLIAPLRDDEPLTLENSFQNLREMKRGVRQFRDLQDQQRAALLQEFSDRQERDRQAALELERVEVERRQQQARPQAAPQPDPAVERARLEASHRQLADLHQMQVEEREAVNEQVQIRQWIEQNYPAQYRTNEGWRQLQQQNPAHAQYLAEFVPQAIQRDQELNAGRQQAALIRQGQQAQAAQAQQASFNAWANQQDTQAEAAIRDEMGIKSDAAWKELQQATRRALRESTGLSDQQLGAAWQQGRWRSLPEQRMLARLGRDQMAREGMKRLNEKREYLPPVRPGLHRPAGASEGDRVAELERALSNATGQRALKLGQQLIQARRAANML